MQRGGASRRPSSLATLRTAMVLRNGDKVLAVHRRSFETDETRLLVGTVLDYESAVAKVRGFAWAWNRDAGGYLRKPDERTQLLALATDSLDVYQLPDEIDPAAVEVGTRGEQRILLSFSGRVLLDLTERPRG